MVPALACAALVCLGSVTVGQGVLRLCGARAFSWLSGPIGLGLLMALAALAIHVPGRSTTVVPLIGLAIAAGIVVMVREGDQRPDLAGVLAVLPVLVLLLVPFASAGYFGTLGVSFNNDNAAHFILAEGYRSELVEQLNPLRPSDYPLGPHALAAALAQGTGARVDQAFVGLMIAGPLLLGWTALAALSTPTRWGRPAMALLAGMPFLVAAYYGQGAFKEVLQALFVLAAALALARPPEVAPLARWVPLACILVGAMSVYSAAGLAWPLAFAGAWLAGTALLGLTRGMGVRALVRAARDGLPAVIVGTAVVAVAMVPQVARMFDFVTGASSSDIAKDNLGNLVGPLPVWPAFGIWDNPDFRLAAVDAFQAGMWTAFAAGLVLAGAIWALRRGEWMLVTAAAIAALIWAVSDDRESPYVAAKALVILSPLLMVLAVRFLAERPGPADRMPRWWAVAAPVLALVLVAKAADASWDALRAGKVGPTDHAREIASLRSTINHRPTLFLGNDDFTRWAFADVPVQAPVIGFQVLPIRDEKPWTYGTAYDIDSLDADTINDFTWVVAPRDAAASDLPEQLRLERTTRNFALYRRVGTVPQREILAEGEGPAGVLDCSTREGRKVVRRGGLARVRDGVVGVAVPPLRPGQSTTVSLPLTAGTWDLVTPYLGPRPLEVRAGRLRTTLPPNLDRPGTRWPIGRVEAAGPLAVTLRADDGRFTPATQVSTPQSVVAVPVGTERTVPVAEACGRFVDWYRPQR